MGTVIKGSIPHLGPATQGASSDCANQTLRGVRGNVIEEQGEVKVDNLLDWERNRVQEWR